MDYSDSEQSVRSAPSRRSERKNRLRDSWHAEDYEKMESYRQPQHSWQAKDDDENSEDEGKINEVLARAQLAQEQKGEIEKLRAENATLREEIAEMRQMLEELLKQQIPTTEKKRKKRNLTSSSSENEVGHPGKTNRIEAATPEDPDVEPAKEAENREKRKAPQPNTEPSQTQKVPPVVLRGKDRWTQISKILNEERINYTKARLTTDGITVTPATNMDYKKMLATLKRRQEEYHTFTPPEDRLLRVVIKGIPGGIAETDVAEDLKEQGFAPAAVHRMKSRRTKQEMPLVLVQLPQAQIKILEVKRCCSLVVKVERQRKQQQATQCHRCQRYGHGQSRCTAQPKCVKCGEDHSTYECKKRREDPAKCANGQGDHPASYRGCPRFPKQRKPDTEKPQKANTMNRRSYAQAAGGSQTPGEEQEQNTTNRGADMETAKSMIAQFQQMLTAMKAFMENIQPQVS